MDNLDCALVPRTAASDSIRETVTGQYRQLVAEAGSTRPRHVFRQMRRILPFRLERISHDNEFIGGHPTTGHAWTDFEDQVHYLSVSGRLRGITRIHTTAHELYHLVFHTPSPTNIDQLMNYYRANLDTDLPDPVLRKLIMQEAAQPHLRAGTDSIWEREAEAFATIVATRQDLVELRPTTSPLLRALGAPNA